ncbi:MAG: TetR/AcrR family transcriptional regulator [Nocardiopsaceae bacterium]|nr:TetR/AcrR family transcriptional regulator [Nocardiopsaceae bacterium]
MIRRAESREADSSAAHRRIIRAAEELFKKSGFQGVTMEAVARDAAVSKATLYSRFRNKDELFQAVCSRMADLTSRAFGEALATQGEAVDQRALSAVLAKHRLTFTLVRSSPHAEDLFTHKAQLAGDLFERAENALLEQLGAVLAEDSALRPSAPQLARALLFAGGELAARSTTVAELESELGAFVTVHLAGARALARTRPGTGRRPA